MLYILGLYEIVLERVYSFHWLSLIPLLVGLIVGTFATTNILEKLMEKYPEQVYMTIIGFVAASIVSLLPAASIANPVICLLVFIIGFMAMYITSRHSQ